MDGDLAANVARTKGVIDEAARAGCDFLCLPEQYLSGYGKPEYAKAAAVILDDPRLLELAGYAAEKGVVTLAGIVERRGDGYADTQVVLDGGQVAGHYAKTMLVSGDRAIMDDCDDELPVFEARGVRFGIMICHDSSFPEIAATLAWKGAKTIFSPHYDSIRRDEMDAHRILVRNNHIGIAAHYGLVVARANVVGYLAEGNRFGYGDSAVFGPGGRRVRVQQGCAPNGSLALGEGGLAD